MSKNTQTVLIFVAIAAVVYFIYKQKKDQQQTEPEAPKTQPPQTATPPISNSQKVPFFETIDPDEFTD